MPRKSDGEKIDELEKLVAILNERLARPLADIKDLYETQTEAQQRDRAHEREVAVLKRELEEHRRWAEKNGAGELKTELGPLKEKVGKLEAAGERAGNRAWSIVPNVLGALVSGGIAALVAFLVARRP